MKNTGRGQSSMQIIDKKIECLMKKCAAVSIIGRPSAGKSTLLNTLCGQKISITAPSPQTTWNAIRGIYTAEQGQLIFIDTPGYHISEKSMNLRMKDISVSSIGESDIILYVADTTRTPGEEEMEIARLLASARQPIIAALNKIDLPQSSPTRIRELLIPVLPEASLVPVSAITGSGLEQLKELLFAAAPEGEQLYPEDFYTDQPPEFRIAEIIRGIAVNRVREELPHAIFVDIADLEIDEEAGTLWIRAFLNVERESQKGMVVGKGGAGIKAIRQGAQKEIGRLFPYKIHLDLRVKTREKWRTREQVLNKLIY
jgi:GTPase